MRTSKPGSGLLRAPAELVHHLGQIGGRLAHQLLGDGGFDAGQLVVYGLDGDRHLLLARHIGGVDRLPRLEHDERQQVGAGGEQQFARVLFDGGGLEQAVESLRPKNVVQGAPKHDTDRAFLKERLKDFGEDHR